MKPCPYRKTHEFDSEGFCKNCYAKTEIPVLTPVLDPSIKYLSPKGWWIDIDGIYHPHKFGDTCSGGCVAADQVTLNPYT
jgi:hypothetical protein